MDNTTTPELLPSPSDICTCEHRYGTHMAGGGPCMALHPYPEQGRKHCRCSSYSPKPLGPECWAEEEAR